MDGKLRILLVDDDQTDRMAIKRALGKSGLECDLVEAACGAMGLAHLQDTSFDCVLLDYRLPDFDGSAVLREMIADSEIPIPIIVLTSFQDERLALQLLKEGAFDYLTKAQIDPLILARSIRYALARRQVLSKEVAERRRVVELADEKARLIEEVASQNRRLEAKNRRLSELYDVAHQFVDNASHEFRTPLTVIKDYASILSDEVVGGLNDDQRELVTVILNRVDDLTIMVSDMLDTSKLETGLLGMVRRSCRIEDVIGRHRGTLEGRASSARVTLGVAIDADLPEVYCDPEKVGRVILNLVINAIKFSGEQGRVELSARHDPETAMVVVGVSDQGPGIAPEHLEAIFERFRQVGGQARASTKGFGLGLNIAKELVQLNLGEMAVTSELGRGSTFSFSVPVDDPALILDRFLERAERSRPGLAAASLISARIPTPGSALLEDMNGFLEQQMRACDLMLRCANDRWLVAISVGEREAGGFIERIEGARLGANRNRLGEPLPPLRLEALGSWRLPDEKVEAVARVCAEFADARPLALAT